MRLSRIELTDYRAYSTAVLDLPPSGLVLVAGPNNSGKSALLSAFDAALLGTSFPHTGFKGRDGWNISLTFATSIDERLTLPEYIQRSNPSALAYIKVTVAPTGWGIIPIVISCGDGPGSMVPVVRLNPQTRRPSVSNVLTGGPQAGREVWHEDSGYSDISYRDGHPAFELMQGFRDLQASFHHVGPLRSGAAHSVPSDSHPNLQPEGGNLPAVLRHLQDNENATFARVAATISNLVPEIGRLGFRSSPGGNVEVVFDDPFAPGIRHNLQDLGTGVEQLLLTLVLGMAQPQVKTVVLEEPETALEPGAQRALLGLLQEWSSDLLIIVSTHSTAMIDWSALGQLYHVRRQGGQSSVEMVDNRRADLLNALGVRMSDMLSAETVLVTEGPTDHDVLAIFLPQLFQTPSIAIVPGTGGNSARLAHEFQAWIRGADTVSARRLVVLRDKDELGPEQVSDMEKKHVVRVLKRREIENYLLDAAALHQALVAEQPLDVTADDIEAALKQAADDTKEAVVLGRVWWQILPVRLVDQTVRSKLADDPDKLSKLIEIACEKLRTKEELAADITELWAAASQDVEAEWSDNWRSLAPGANVLMKLYRRYLGRKFNKGTDGPKLARAVMKVSGTPPELVDLLGDLVGLP